MIPYFPLHYFVFFFFKNPAPPEFSPFPLPAPLPFPTPRAPPRGTPPPLVTPLLDRDRLDIAGLERLIEHVLGGGVHGLFLLGTTGEAPSLSHRLRCEIGRAHV